MERMAVATVSELNRLVGSGTPVKYLHFWGHTQRRPGVVDASCLSQWWPAKFTVDGVGFATAEHYMMWRKARLFGDEDAARRIPGAGHPNAAKQLGRTVTGFDTETWERHRFDIVVDGNRAKFGQHEPLRDFLLGTRKRVLVEASPYDRVWGIGMAADHPHAQTPSRWRGLNLLGFALMAVREELAG